MKNYKVIYDKVLKKIQMGERKFIIYPMGQNGLLVNNILTTSFGIKDILKADNILSKLNQEIFQPEELGDREEYTWLITSEKYSLTMELLELIEPLNIKSDKLCVLFDRQENLYGDEYKVLSKIGKVVNSEPCWEFIEIIKRKKDEKRLISVAEIGIDVGATAVEACKLLEESDSYYLFDFENKVEDLKKDLGNVSNITCEIKAYGNSDKIYDSYCYTLCDLLFDMRNKGLNGIFDVVYLDGLHGFNVDGLAVCLLKELMKSGAYIVFDDLYWSWKIWLSKRAESEMDSNKTWVSERWTDEQIAEPQVRRVVNAFMINDTDYEEVKQGRLNPFGRIVYKKK